MERRPVAGSNQAWNVGAGYTRTTGSSLDIVRAPNRGPDGSADRRRAAVPLADVGGISVLNAGDVPRAAAHGERASAAARPTRSPSRWTTRPTSAAAGRSSRRTTRTWPPSSRSRASIGAISSTPICRSSCPSGRTSGGCTKEDAAAAVVRRLARLGDVHLAVGHAVDAARDRRRERRRRAAPTARCARTTTASRSRSTIRRSPVLQYRGVHACRCPARSATRRRNMIIGPGSRLLNGQFSRDIRMKSNRALTMQVTAHQHAQHGQLRAPSTR